MNIERHMKSLLSVKSVRPVKKGIKPLRPLPFRPLRFRALAFGPLPIWPLTTWSSFHIGLFPIGPLIRWSLPNPSFSILSFNHFVLVSFCPLPYILKNFIFQKWEKWNFGNFREPSIGLPVLQPFVVRLLLDNACCVNHQINPRLPKGGGYYPPIGLSQIAPKRKTKWPRASIKVISFTSLRLFGKNIGLPPNTGGRGSHQSPRLRVWLSPENILSRPFEKYLHDIDLKFTEHVRNAIFLL